MRYADCFSLLDEKDVRIFHKLEYVKSGTEEPLTDLCLDEVNDVLNRVVLSRNAKKNKLYKCFVWLHCLGYKDSEIAEGLNTILENPLTVESVKKARQRALKKIGDCCGVSIGLITIMRETFRD